MSRGAIIDYGNDTLYLLAAHESPSTSAPPIVAQSTLKEMLAQAGQYTTFLDLMARAGLMSLLDSSVDRIPAHDSLDWIGLRVGALGLSGVGAMPVNDLHLKLTRQAIDREIRGPNLITVFAPTDAAFAKLPAEAMRALRTDTARLTRFLQAHIFVGTAIDTIAMQTYIRGAARPGSNGPAFGFHSLGAQMDVDRLDNWENGRVIARATIVTPEMQTEHGLSIAYGIDRLLDQVEAPPAFTDTLIKHGYVAVPLHRREDGNGYYVQAYINNAPLKLTIATGAYVSVALDQRAAEPLQLVSDHDYIIALDSVKLAPTSITIKDFSAPMQAVQRQGYRTTTGIVGTRLLARYHAIVDYGQGMLYLKNLKKQTATAQ
jgi:hypothetical protein